MVHCIGSHGSCLEKVAWVAKSYIGIYKFSLHSLDQHCACLVASFARSCSNFELFHPINGLCIGEVAKDASGA